MAKTSRQKEKLLFLATLLLEESDEKHPLSMKYIISKLEDNDIKAERKSIYDDIEVLNKYGLDIELSKAEPKGYYVASREFEIAELKLLVDAVWASRFITQKKTNQLIKKLSSLVSINDAGKLKRQIMISDRVKSMNESVFYNVDALHNAIGLDVKVEFYYYEWLPDKEIRLKNNGKKYVVSPWMLYWNDEFYYLIAYDNNSGIIKYFRVDKMKELCLTQEQREGKVAYEKLVKNDFSKGTFGMFAGEEKYVVMTVKNNLAGVIIDRFGTEVFMHPLNNENFTFKANVTVSNQFFGWVAGLGTDARITAPEEVVVQYREYIQEILKSY